MDGFWFWEFWPGRGGPLDRRFMHPTLGVFTDDFTLDPRVKQGVTESLLRPYQTHFDTNEIRRNVLDWRAGLKTLTGEGFFNNKVGWRGVGAFHKACLLTQGLCILKHIHGSTDHDPVCFRIEGWHAEFFK